MRDFAAIEAAIDVLDESGDAAPRKAEHLLGMAEEILESWIIAHGAAPTSGTREGFRLLALQRQGAQDLPSFNACRETCREIAYHYNLILSTKDAGAGMRDIRMMALVTRHLLLFVGGKMQSAQLGEFCCASRPLRHEAT